jgi:hypothetical protein
MTFAEELKKISEEVSVNRVIKERCAIMKDRMKSCAKEGYRTYQVEVIKPICDYEGSGAPENYQIISIHKNHCINDYIGGIYAYLINNLGFKLSDIEKANFQNCRYVSTQITIRW